MRRAPAEGGAFLAVEPSHGRLLLRSTRVFRDEELEPDAFGLILRDQAKVALLAELKGAGHGVIDVHTHPGSDRRVDFSALDQAELPAYARYVQLKLGGKAFGALVLGRHSYAGTFFDKSQTRTLRIHAVGERADIPPWVSAREEYERGPSPDLRVHDRQLRALGPAGQARLIDTCVGIVGLGGTGSVVVQQLAHLGVRSYVLVDDDVVEESNLNRLATATRADARKMRRKDEVAERLIRRLAQQPMIVRTGTLRTRESLRHLAGADLIIGCVDNDGARLILAELAAAHLIPYLDIGVSVQADARGLQMGGRTAFHVPGGPCLACADELDFGEAAEDLESESLRKIRLSRGYAEDRRIEAALMPLNTTVAGLAVTEAVCFITGVRRVVRFQRYDYSGSRLVPIYVERDHDCPVCMPAFAMGDRQQLDRYAL